MTALDGDSGNNARVTYRVSSGDDRGSLDVHPSTGWVYVRGPLDRETQDTYELTVVATDNGSPSALAATVVVVITVDDVNDNDPEFDREYYEFHVEENRPPGTVFGAVSATDRDASDNALVRYSLIPTNSSFNINLYSGKCGHILYIIHGCFWGFYFLLREIFVHNMNLFFNNTLHVVHTSFCVPTINEP